MMNNIHATCIKLKNKGILFLGLSGSGKSDLALRLIINHKAKLIADDRVDVCVKGDKVYASSPKILKGLLEVRGIGIVPIKHLSQNRIHCVVELISSKPDRMPENMKYEINGVKLPLIKLNPFEVSAPEKIITWVSLL